MVGAARVAPPALRLQTHAARRWWVTAVDGRYPSRTRTDDSVPATAWRRGLQTWPARRSSGEHWYHAHEGTPCYQVAQVADPSQQRTPDVRDARRLSLLPSVTTVLGIVNRPGIQYWRMQQYLQAVRDFQAQAGSSAAMSSAAEAAAAVAPEALDSAGTVADEGWTTPLEEWQWREVQLLYNRKISQAAEVGTEVHALIDAHIRWRYQVGPEKTSRSSWPTGWSLMREALDRWLDEHVAAVAHVEQSFACRYGFGGKVDLVCRLHDGSMAVCDFKTQAARKRFQLHSFWPCQLVAYAVAFGVPSARLINVCLDTVVPGTHLIKEWSLSSAANGGEPSASTTVASLNEPYWNSFRLAFQLWCSPLGRSFDPSEEVRECVPIPDWAGVLRDAAADRPVSTFGLAEVTASAAGGSARFG